MDIGNACALVLLAMPEVPVGPTAIPCAACWSPKPKAADAFAEKSERWFCPDTVRPGAGGACAPNTHWWIGRGPGVSSPSTMLVLVKSPPRMWNPSTFFASSGRGASLGCGEEFSACDGRRRDCTGTGAGSALMLCGGEGTNLSSSPPPPLTPFREPVGDDVKERNSVDDDEDIMEEDEGVNPPSLQSFEADCPWPWLCCKPTSVSSV